MAPKIWFALDGWGVDSGVLYCTAVLVAIHPPAVEKPCLYVQPCCVSRDEMMILTSKAGVRQQSSRRFQLSPRSMSTLYHFQRPLPPPSPCSASHLLRTHPQATEVLLRRLRNNSGTVGDGSSGGRGSDGGDEPAAGTGEGEGEGVGGISRSGAASPDCFSPHELKALVEVRVVRSPVQATAAEFGVE